MAPFKVQDGETFLFIGDSITDCGRREQARPLGNGYVRMAVDLVTARYPERAIRFINTGISGNTILDLQDRWTEDVLDHSPDWLSIKIGINDLHRTLNGVRNVSVPVFEEAYRHVIVSARNHCDPKLMLIDPFYICRGETAEGFERTVLRTLPGYLDVVSQLADEFGALRVTTHDLFREQLKHREPGEFCGEPVHPNPTGHMVIAHGVLAELGW